MPVAAMVMESPLEEAFKEVPEKEEPEKADAEPTRATKAQANFIVS